MAKLTVYYLIAHYLKLFSNFNSAIKHKIRDYPHSKLNKAT